MMNVELHLVGQSPMSFLEHRESIFSVATDDLFTLLTSACMITELLMNTV